MDNNIMSYPIEIRIALLAKQFKKEYPNHNIPAKILLEYFKLGILPDPKNI